MSVRVGDRDLSKIEVLYQALKLNEAVVDLSFRTFGINSKKSILRRKYRQMLSYEHSDDVNNFVEYEKELILKYSTQVVDLLNGANSIYPKFKSEYELRLNYQNNALAYCDMISKELNNVAKYFDVDINEFKIVIPLLDREKHLIREWRKSDRRRFKGYLL